MQCYVMILKQSRSIAAHPVERFNAHLQNRHRKALGTCALAQVLTATSRSIMPPFWMSKPSLASENAELLLHS